MILYYESNNPISTGLKESRFITADPDGLLYIAGDQKIIIMDSTGKSMQAIDLSFSPLCMVSTDKRFYIGIKERVVITDKKGKTEDTWKSLGENAWITGLAVTDEYLFIADAGQRIVWCYDLNGSLVRQIGGKNPEKNIQGFVIPGPYFDIAMAPDGLLRVANPGRHQIEAYTVKGDMEFAWGKFGHHPEDFTACCNPVSFAVLSDGSIITCEKGIARVKIYDTFGNLKGYVAGPKQLADESNAVGSKKEQIQRYGFDIAADDNGHVYILDRARNLLRFFKAKKNGFPPSRE
jgi:hypothetical protein